MKKENLALQLFVFLLGISLYFGNPTFCSAQDWWPTDGLGILPTVEVAEVSYPESDNPGFDPSYTACDPPSDIGIEVFTPNDLLINWSSVPMALSYTITVEINGIPYGTYTVSAPTTSLNVFIWPGLQGGDIITACSITNCGTNKTSIVKSTCQSFEYQITAATVEFIYRSDLDNECVSGNLCPMSLPNECINRDGTPNIFNANDICNCSTPNITCEALKACLRQKTAFLIIDKQQCAPNSISPRKQSKISMKNISLYPNPIRNTGQLTYHLNGEGTLSLRIFNVLGTLQYESYFRQETGNHSITLDVEHLPPGTYYYQIANEETEHTAKFVKIH